MRYYINFKILSYLLFFQIFSVERKINRCNVRVQFALHFKFSLQMLRPILLNLYGLKSEIQKFSRCHIWINEFRRAICEI